MTIPIFTALVVAAGDGTRMESSCVPKQYNNIVGYSLLHHTLTRVISPYNCPIQVVIKPDHSSFYRDTVLSLPKNIRQLLREPTFGGTRRQDSVRLGLQSLKGINPEFVIIHDACRPFADIFPRDAIFSHIIDAVGVVPVMPLSETVGVIKNNVIANTVQRESICIIQTPQIFRYRDILDCHEKTYSLTPEKPFTDDSTLALHCNLRVATMRGNVDNIKITTQNDLIRAMHYLSRMELVNASSETAFVAETH